jgi:hypothetical protein
MNLVAQEIEQIEREHRRAKLHREPGDPGPGEVGMQPRTDPESGEEFSPPKWRDGRARQHGVPRRQHERQHQKENDRGERDVAFEQAGEDGGDEYDAENGAHGRHQTHEGAGHGALCDRHMVGHLRGQRGLDAVQARAHRAPHGYNAQDCRLIAKRDQRDGTDQ